MLNSTGIPDTERINMYGYNVYQRNVMGENNAGIAICVRRNIQHRIVDDFVGDMLGTRVETSRGPVTINTVYLPPRRNGIPLAEIRREFQRNQAVYLFGDLNARHNALGYNSTNNTGQEIVNLMRNDICSFLGPDFNTLVSRHIRGHPDILLGNRNAVFYYRMYEGIITTSDHIPVILELSTQPFLIQTQPRLRMNKTNWDHFRQLVKDEMMTNEQNIRNAERISQREIDEYIKKWMDVIRSKVEETTPTSIYNLQPNVKESDELKLIVQIYNRIRFQTNHWTIEHLNIIRDLQQRIKTEMNRLTTEFWDNKINNL